MKEEALKLAEIFEEVGRAKYPYHLDAAEMLRRLVEELDKLNGCLIAEQEHNEMLQTKPLSDDEIKEIWFALERELGTCIKYGFKFARAIEERHGIK